MAKSREKLEKKYAEATTELGHYQHKQQRLENRIRYYARDRPGSGRLRNRGRPRRPSACRGRPAGISRRRSSRRSTGWAGRSPGPRRSSAGWPGSRPCVASSDRIADPVLPAAAGRVPARSPAWVRSGCTQAISSLGFVPSGRGLLWLRSMAPGCLRLTWAICRGVGFRPHFCRTHASISRLVAKRRTGISMGGS